MNFDQSMISGMMVGDLFALSVGISLAIFLGNFVLELFAIDVIHALALPALATKIDAIPARIAELFINISANGNFRGQCSELCGILHAFMPLQLSAI